MDAAEFAGWLEARGLSARAAAKELGTSHPTIAAWASGKSAVPPAIEAHCRLQMERPDESAIIAVAEAGEGPTEIEEEPPPGLAFDPVALKCDPLPPNPRGLQMIAEATSNVPAGATLYSTGWQVIPECGVICHKDIPEPTCWSAPGYKMADHWAIMSRDGRVWNQWTGKQIAKSLRLTARADPKFDKMRHSMVKP